MHWMCERRSRILWKALDRILQKLEIRYILSNRCGGIEHDSGKTRTLRGWHTCFNVFLTGDRSRREQHFLKIAIYLHKDSKSTSLIIPQYTVEEKRTHCSRYNFMSRTKRCFEYPTTSHGKLRWRAWKTEVYKSNPHKTQSNYEHICVLFCFPIFLFFPMIWPLQWPQETKTDRFLLTKCFGRSTSPLIKRCQERFLNRYGIFINVQFLCGALCHPIHV